MQRERAQEGSFALCPSCPSTWASAQGGRGREPGTCAVDPMVSGLLSLSRCPRPWTRQASGLADGCFPPTVSCVTKPVFKSLRRVYGGTWFDTHQCGGRCRAQPLCNLCPLHPSDRSPWSAKVRAALLWPNTLTSETRKLRLRTGEGVWPSYKTSRQGIRMKLEPHFGKPGPVPTGTLQTRGLPYSIR